jgi:hypothetical protein
VTRMDASIMRSVVRRSNRSEERTSSSGTVSKRKDWSRRGVSDVIGNLLILAITVTLFSSIFWFVSSMPGPSEKVYTDFSSSIIPNDDGANISITNKGGEALENDRILIYLFDGDETHTYYISDSNPSIGDTWNIGSTWSIFVEGITSSTPINVMIVDTKANTIVWQNNLQGSSTSTGPIIGGRGITNTSQPVAGTIFAGNYVRFFAYVYLPVQYGTVDESSVKVNVSALTGLSTLGTITLKNDGSGMYWSEQSYPASIAWTGKYIYFSASDSTGITTQVDYQVTVLQGGGGGGGGGGEGPLDQYSDYLVNGDYPPDASGGERGGGANQLGTTFYYIKRASDGTITRDFEPGEQVLIEFYSNTMLNLALANSFEMTHPYTGAALADQSKYSSAFTYTGLYSGFYRYTYTFNAPTDPLKYPFQVLMKDYYGTNLNVRDSISVDGAIYPIIETYVLDSTNHTLIPTTNFVHTDTIYVKVITKDVDSDLSKVKVGVVEISDYSGRYLIRSAPATATAYPAAPGYVAPISSVYKTSSSTNSDARVADTDSTGKAGEYTFYIQLKAADLGWWLPMKNSYTLKVTSLIDLGSPGQGETYYNIATQFNVTAPMSLTDIVASIGTGSYTWSSTGASWDNNKLKWFEKGVGSDAWGSHTIADPTYNGPLSMTLTDMDNDGIKDLVVAFQDSSVSLAWYRCENVEGTLWSETPNIIAMPFDAYAGTQAVTTTQYGHGIYGTNDKGIPNEDATLWIPAGTTLGGSGWFGYTFPGGFVTRSSDIDFSPISTNELCVSMETGDFNGDGYTDVVASYAHTVVYSTASSESDAKSHPEESQGMFFNRGVYVFWGGHGWTKTALGGTMNWASTSGSAPKCNSDDNPAILDLAVGDFNKDGCDDIVGVDETGKTYIWMSAWKESVLTSDPYTNAFSASPIIPDVTSTVGGYKPFDHTQRTPHVEVAQMDNKGYLDIIRTSTKNNAVYVIHTTGKDTALTYSYPTTEYGTNATKTSAAITHTNNGKDGSGYYIDLTGIDANVETITEVYLESDIFRSEPQAKGLNDTTGQLLANVQKSDGVAYNVAPAPLNQMLLQSFYVNPSDYGKTVASVTLHVQYSADSGYNGNANVLWSTNGVNYVSTGIKPSSSVLNVHATYNLYANGVDTVGELLSLEIAFQNTGSAGAVRFDAVWLEVTYAEGRYLEWQYETPNQPMSSIHNLTIVARCSSADEQYNVSYSWDNSTWFFAGTIQGTTQTTYNFNLYYSSNSKYYFRIDDVNRATGQTENRSLIINMFRVGHYSPGVEWIAGNLKTSETIPSPGGSNYFISALAVGDVGRSSADSSSGASHMTDGLNDVVVATTKVGEGTSTYTLFVSTQTAGELDPWKNIPTPTMAGMVGSSTLYDSANIALGDFDADYDLDICLVIGFAPGMSGTPTMPTIWLYYNEPQIGSWSFTEKPLSALGANEAGINIETGDVNLSILFPIFGLAGVVVASAAIERLGRKQKR